MIFTVQPASAGGWHTFACDPRLLMVLAAVDEFVTAAWAAIRRDDGFQATLDLLTSRGLAATPAFVLIEWTADSTARIIVRGESELIVTDAAGEQRLSAAGVSTWVERTMTGVTTISFAAPGATALGSAMLPLERGVVLAASVASEGAVLPAGTDGESATSPAVLDAPEVPVVVSKPRAVQAAAVSPPPLPAVVAPEVDVEATVREAPEVLEVADDASGYDYLFGDTMYRNVADAAVHEPDAEAEAVVPPEAVDVDDTLHDGETVLTSDIAKLRAKRRPKTTVAAPPPAPKLTLVVAPTGAREPLTQPILMGRSPSISKVSGGQIPRLVTIGTVDQDISRNHAQFSLEGGTVVVTDLHSRNGTMMQLPGKSAQKLRAGEPTSVIVGTVIDFGGGVTVTVEEES